MPAAWASSAADSLRSYAACVQLFDCTITGVRGGQSLTFELEGQPGELPLLFVSSEHEPIPMLNGTLLVGLPPSHVFVLAPLPASGQGALTFPVPNVSAGVASLTFYAQVVFLDPTHTVWLGAGTTVVLLDASF